MKLKMIISMALVLLCVCGKLRGDETVLTWDDGTTQSGTAVYSTNSPAGTYFFKITTQASGNSAGYWRSVLKMTSGEADLYLKRDSLPSTEDSDASSTETGNDTVTLPLVANEEWFLMVAVTDAAQWSLFAGDMHVEILTWDDGSAELGTVTTGETSSQGEDRYFKLITENADLGMWRTVLDVSSNDAALYMSRDVLPVVNESINTFQYKSDRTGDDGLVLPLSNTAGGGQIWYILVKPQTGSSWNLFSGDVFVSDLGSLASDDSSGSGLAVIPAEGVRYFKTTIPVETMAWRLWLQDATGTNTWNQPLTIRNGLAPHPTNSTAYDLKQTGQMLVVPNYLIAGGSSPYYIGIAGNPGDSFCLDSRRHTAEPLEYLNTVSGTATGFRFKTYSVTVPPDQIAWELTLTPEAGSNPDMAIGLAKIPNAYNNAAFSELASTNQSESITLVPPFLSSGTYYITLYATNNFSFSLQNRQPVITPMNFLDLKVNDDVNRAGWRFYAVTQIDQQLGYLGWLLTLTNQIADSEIAIRRNNIPGRWSYRENDSATIKNLAYSTKSSSVGFLQDPDHEADVWYVGIYSPGAALGAFHLMSEPLIAVEADMDDSSFEIPLLAPKSWNFFHVNVPSQIGGEIVLGWELRIPQRVNGSPKIVVRRDRMPKEVKTSGTWGGTISSPHLGTNWPSGSAWAGATGEWSGYLYDTEDGQQNPQSVLTMAMGRPLEPGSYYVGVYNDSADQGCEYTLESRAIGTGMSYAVGTLGFAGGSTNCSALPARGVAYYQVDVPANQPSWKIRLENITGESMLYLRRGYIPTSGQSGAGYFSPGEKNNEQIGTVTRLKKTGDEYFVLFPEDIYDNKPNDEPPVLVPEGRYYLMVVSEGINPANSVIGTGSSDAVLHSYGPVTPIELGVLDQGNVLEYHGSYEAGEINYLQFVYGEGIGWYQCQFENTNGQPYHRSLWRVVPDNDGGYSGRYGGMYSGYSYDDRENIPCSSTLNVIVSDVRPAAQIEAGTYDLSISRVPSTEIEFEGGGASVTGLCGSVVYKVVTPLLSTGVLGWEIRLKEWSGVRPSMTVCLEDFPDPYTLGQTVSYDGKSWKPQEILWPLGYQWAVSQGDWTGYAYDPGQTQSSPQYLMSMGKLLPFAPGLTYYICFNNPNCSEESNFTFESRGIGPSRYYAPSLIGFDGGSAIITNLAARDVAYFTVEVPEGAASWKVHLENTLGESSLYIRKDSPPTTGQTPLGYCSPGLSTGENKDKVTRLQKTGDEYFVLLPEENNTVVTAGTYYLMVVSEGQNPSGSTIGSGTSSAVLHSLGEADVINLGALPQTGEIEQSGGYAAGDSLFYQFTVPAGVHGMEIRLKNVSGVPKLNLTPGLLFPEMDDAVSKRYGGLYSGLKILDKMRGFEVVTVSDPTNDVWSLLISDPQTAALLQDGTFTLSILTLSTEPISFDGGTVTVSNLPPNNWVFFDVDVPSAGEPNGNFKGWELRVTNWSGAVPPIMAVRRNSLPDGTTTHNDTGGSWKPALAVTWPDKYQWATAASPKDWTEYTYAAGHGQRYPEYLLSMGKDRPLVPGSYLIGFYNPSTSVTGEFTCVSRMIGEGGSYTIRNIAFDGGSADITDLPVRGVEYFKVTVPTNVPSWNLRLENLSGESMLYIRKDFLPTWEQTGSSIYAPDTGVDKLVKLKKLGDEHYTLLPKPEEPFIPGGDYYLMVVSEGVNPTSTDSGSGSSSARLHSLGPDTETDLGELHEGTTLSNTVQYAAGDLRLYHFSVAPDVQAVELRLSNRTGMPNMNVLAGAACPSNTGLSSYYGGMYSGYKSAFSGQELITLPNPSTGTWSMVVSDPNAPANLSDGSCTLTLSALSPVTINADASSNTNGGTHLFSGSLADGQRQFFMVEIPPSFNGNPVPGWYLTTSTAQGTAKIRARYGLLPDDTNRNQTGWGTNALIVVPPFLTNGTWFVEVEGSGATAYTLSSTLMHPQQTWVMPSSGETATTPGVPAPLFGDSGVNTNGLPLEGDQGITLNRGFYDLYAVTVPGTNTGLFSTRLEAISGNPDLYVRKGDVPTLNHDTDNIGSLYDHRLNNTNFTQYGNWVQPDGRNETQLSPGTWYILIKAEGSSDARYRLKLSDANVFSGGPVQTLSLTNGSYTAQVLAKGDWRYYRVEMPDPVPAQWNFGFSVLSGDVDLYLRDTIPPGNCTNFSDLAADIIDWRKDNKMSGTEACYPTEGQTNLPYSMLKPEKTYYMGFCAKADSSFSVTSSVEGGSAPEYPSLDFYSGSDVTNLLPGASITYQIAVPTDAVRWKHSTSNSSSVVVYLKQGGIPSTTEYDWRRTTGSGSLNQFLRNGTWPWLTGETYYLTAVNNSTNQNPFSVTMEGSSAIERPINLSATDGTRSDDVSVTWTGVSGASAYEVWRSLLPDAETATRIAERHSSTTYIDAEAVPGVTNYYWAALFESPDREWFSDSDGGWRSTLGEVSQTLFVFGFEGGSNTLSVTAEEGLLWGAYESLSWLSFSGPVTGTSSGTVSFTVAMSAAATTRTGTVVVAGNPVTIIQTAYGVPSGVQASDGLYPDQITVNWNPMPYASLYYVYRALSTNSASSVLIGTAVTNEYLDTTALPDLVYFYWIKARNAGGTSGFSDYDTGSLRSSEIATWIATHFPGGYGGDDNDADHDGFSNIDEFISGSDPTNALSFFCPLFLGRGTDGFVTFEVDEAANGRIYDIQWCNSLNPADWEPVGLNEPGRGGTLTLRFYDNGIKLFLRPTVKMAE